MNLPTWVILWLCKVYLSMSVKSIFSFLKSGKIHFFQGLIRDNFFLKVIDVVVLPTNFNALEPPRKKIQRHWRLRTVFSTMICNTVCFQERINAYDKFCLLAIIQLVLNSVSTSALPSVKFCWVELARSYLGFQSW